MSHSITAINTLLIDIKTINTPLLIKLQQAGFDTSLHLGFENEYTVKSLLNRTDNLIIHFLTITANRMQFLQRTSFAERQDMTNILKKLYISLKETQNTLSDLHNDQAEIIHDATLSYKIKSGKTLQLALIHSIDYIDMLKPFSRMLELLIAQERIVALSAVLETLLQKDRTSSKLDQVDDVGLTDEQTSAMELSHYLIKQAL